MVQACWRCFRRIGCVTRWLLAHKRRLLNLASTAITTNLWRRTFLALLLFLTAKYSQNGSLIARVFITKCLCDLVRQSSWRLRITRRTLFDFTPGWTVPMPAYLP